MKSKGDGKFYPTCLPPPPPSQKHTLQHTARILSLLKEPTFESTDEWQKCWDSFISQGMFLYLTMLNCTLCTRHPTYPQTMLFVLFYKINVALCSSTTVGEGGSKNFFNTLEDVARKIDAQVLIVLHVSVSTIFVTYCTIGFNFCNLNIISRSYTCLSSNLFSKTWKSPTKSHILRPILWAWIV